MIRKDAAKVQSLGARTARLRISVWWIINSTKPIIAAMGDGDIVTYIDHEQQLLIAITALFRENVYDSIAYIQQDILPLV